MSDKTSLGDRMKRYEQATHQILLPRSYTILRVDLRGGHAYLRNANKPFDTDFMLDMNDVAKVLCDEITGSQFAYTQSDEISVLYTDFQHLNTQPWFGGMVTKQVSIGAALATARMLSNRVTKPGLPLFDARVFTLPDAVEVANYFVWRQRDAIRNSVMMAARAFMSHAEVQGKNTDQLKEELIDRFSVDWTEYPAGARLGRVIFKTLGQWIAEPAEPPLKAESDNWLTGNIPTKPAFD